jgi:hypothetical protein
LSIDDDVEMRGENLGGGVARRNWEGLGETGRISEGGGRIQKKLPMGLDSFL